MLTKLGQIVSAFAHVLSMLAKLRQTSTTDLADSVQVAGGLRPNIKTKCVPMLAKCLAEARLGRIRTDVQIWTDFS